VGRNWCACADGHDIGTPEVFCCSGGSRRAGGRRAFGRRRALSGSADPACSAVSARRRVRHCRPPLGRQGESEPRLGFRRQSARRRGIARRAARRACSGRRLHDFSWRFLDPSHRDDPARAPATRSDQGIDADIDGGDHLLRHRRQSQRAGPLARRARRIRQSQSRQDGLWLRRHRHFKSSQRRALKIVDRHYRSAARAVSRRRPCHCRRHRWPDPDDHPRLVMAGLVPAIHVFRDPPKMWMPARGERSDAVLRTAMRGHDE